jgi:hypothetical protein
MERQRWLAKARRSGLDDEGIDASFRDGRRSAQAAADIA